jgi:hypothetical protein
MIDFNTEPYNDDYDENQKFYRILFRPSFAVQARELTQLQTILQKQISRHGDHVFKQGAMVIPGQISIDNNVQYVKLQPLYAGVAVETFLSNLLGKTIIGANGLVAEVIKVQSQETTEPTTIYVRYKNSGTDGETKVFADSETISTEDSVYEFQAETSAATGTASIVTIERGVYYVNGHFVLVDAHSLILDKYTNTPSYRIGLSVTESVITPEEEETLLDNAQNSYNYAAPGAHRYFIDLQLAKLPLDSTEDSDFIELLRVNEGFNQKLVNKTEYAEIEKTLARRTYDESGDYTVRDFAIDIREHRTNDRGAWTSTTNFMLGDIVSNGGNTYVAKNTGTSVSIAPTHTTGTAYDGPGSTGINWEYTTNPVYNRGIFLSGDDSKLAIGLEPGKAYVRGYEIEKIATEYVAVNKARDFVQADNAFITATVGNFIYVTNLNNLPPVNTFATVDLYNQITNSAGRGTAVGTKIGTARVRFIDWDNGTIGSTSAVYKVSLFDVQLLNGYTFDRHVKSMFYNGGSAATSFSADINPNVTQLIGSVTASGTTVTGTGTSFQTDLVTGDYISVNGSLYRVTAIASQVSLTIGTSLTATGSAYGLVKTKLNESDLDSLLFSLPYYAVKSLRSALGTNDTSYTSYERFTGTTSSASGGTCSLTVSTSSGTMASGAVNGNYILTNNTTGNIILPDSITPSGSSVTFTLNASYASSPFVVIGAVNKTGSTNTEKTKTLNSATVTFTTQATATATTLLLGKSDAWRIVSVKMKSGTFASPGSTYSIDISDRYDFDNGQRSTYYDVGRLTLKDTYVPPSAPIEVVFEYFTHSTGDYCSVNSYPADVSYKEIPPVLRDSLDFRPRIDDAGLVFSGSGSATLIPKRGADVRTDFTYYLARKEKIAVDVNGNFFSISGTSSINPGEPEDPATGMVLYKLALEPYTFGTSSNNVDIKKIDNKRYTMRDIGKLEKRIDNLEYYTSLSLLEQETQNLKISDSTGLDRLKNGFIVDNFNGHGVGASNSPDYKCSVDMQKGELRPFYTMKNVNMIEKNSNDTQRAASFYEQNGDIITLPILEDIVLVKQDFASRLENINPFAIFTFIGDVKMNPPADEWFEVDRRPDIVTNVEGNFTTVSTLAEKAGVLGTVWNAWQTQWAGTPVSSGVQRYEADRRWGDGGASLDNLFGLGPEASGWAHRVVTAEVFATQVGQSRTGVQTSIVSKVDRQVVADRVLSSAVIPYIRSRNLLVQVRGLKPSTRFYPFFDNIDVSTYCTPASKITYTAGTGTFDHEKNVGGIASETARRISGDSQVCLNKGDVITGVTSNATAVVVGSETDPDTGSTALYVVNIIGTFQANEQITGSITNATGTINSITLASIGGSIVANKNGDVNLLFNIPNTESVRFRTGSREFKLVDNSVATGDYTSRGRAQYRAEGIVETRQSLVNAVRNAEIVQETVQDSQTIIETSSRVISDTGWYDPLAQTFLVDNKGGAFLTKVDIFFASKDSQIPVTMEIREVVNGYPGKRVLPFSRVTLKPEQVNLSVNTVDLDGVETPTYDTPTSFTFKSPVYVQDAGEYCIVLISDSNKYKCWISQVGDVVPGTSRTISEQPYAGSLFKSQNASTWTTDQTQDLKFTIHRAKFDTSAVGTIQFVNDVLPYSTLETDPFQTTSGSTTVRVWHKDHGLSSGSKVIITGASGTLNGIPSAELNGTKTVSNIDLDSYTIVSTTSATATGYAGGSAIKATGQVQYDAVYPIAQVQSFSETSVMYSIKTTSGKSVDGTETPYVQDIAFGDCLSNENNYFYSPRLIASEVNENTSIGGNKSVTFAVNFSSTNDSLSPVLDTQRMSLVAISNKINSPTHANTDVTPVDYTQLFTGSTGAFSFSGSTITSSVSAVRTLASTINVGQYILISGATTLGNNGQFLVTNVYDDGSSVTITVSGITFTSESAVSGTTVSTVNLFADEITPVGSSAASKYVTNVVKLALPSTFVKIRFAANVPFNSDVDVYYKTSLGSTGTLDKTKYTLATPVTPATKVENGNETFYDVDYSITGLNPFDAIQVKLVMKSTNTSAIPRIKDLRIIACA